MNTDTTATPVKRKAKEAPRFSVNKARTRVAYLTDLDAPQRRVTLTRCKPYVNALKHTIRTIGYLDGPEGEASVPLSEAWSKGNAVRLADEVADVLAPIREAMQAA